MRYRYLIFGATAVLLIALLAGCGAGDGQGKTTAPTNPQGQATTPKAPQGQPAARQYVADFDGVKVALIIPSTSAKAEEMRQLMSQSPPYLIADMKISNGCNATVRYYDFKPVLLYSGGRRVEGSNRTLLETDMIAPGEAQTALFEFAASGFDGLEKVLVERAGAQPREAVLAVP